MLEPWQLYESLPKPCFQWSVDEVVEWLQLNGLDSLECIFRERRIDGKEFASLTQQRIQTELKITFRQAVRRLIEWAEQERKEFDEYCQEQQDETELLSTKQKQPRRGSFERTPSEFRSINPPVSISTNKDSIMPATNLLSALTPLANVHYLKPVKKESTKSCVTGTSSNSTAISLLTERARCKMHLKHLRVTHLSTKKEFVVTESARIGRQTMLDIVLSEDSVSRTHAEVVKKGPDYFLLDKSRFGTFVENLSRTEVVEGRIFLFASQEIRVEWLELAKDKFDLKLLMPDDNNRQYVANSCSEVIIGRKSNDLRLQDLQIAPLHAKIYLEGGKVYLENLQGTTFTRLRDSELLKLTCCNIKIGCTSVLRMELEYCCQVCTSSLTHSEINTKESPACQGKKSK